MRKRCDERAGAFRIGRGAEHQKGDGGVFVDKLADLVLRAAFADDLFRRLARLRFHLRGELAENFFRGFFRFGAHGFGHRRPVAELRRGDDI